MQLWYYIVLAFFICSTVVFVWLFADRQVKLRRTLLILKKKKMLESISVGESLADIPSAPASAAAEDETPDAKETHLESGYTSDEIGQKLKKAFEVDKVYLNTGLTIKKLSEQIGVPKAVLSHYINNTLNLSFPNFLADYRVNEALRLFNDPACDIYTIEAIGEMCGFASRQVFHKHFKRRTGVPPRRFR